ncbi:hypothetical protein [Pseudoalteromonas umbrosa]|uniref:hypothetical protein n=1 Tax=Pseudoalteromonas umbrosa TaxID=3048489 RepID=UPI0024C423F4|nr:hypothetical protein [Pseudoalteromonas sp. B95]MDK1289815.1 hypothetical protein [Pseudoalteromonas sp. B95]
MNELIKTPEEAKRIIEERNARINQVLLDQGKARRRRELHQDEMALVIESKEVWE